MASRSSSVKEEVYKVARRHGLKVWVVSNAYMQVPREPFDIAIPAFSLDLPGGGRVVN